jgi:hypothetical protein
MRTEIDASDYFGNQKKAAAMTQRRPAISGPSDLVGPGIAASATRITNFNDTLATYNGYYSALSTALHAPTTAENFIGTVVMDSLLGGVQVFTGMTSRIEYTRPFRRLAGDPLTIDWSAPWRTIERIQPAAAGELRTNTTVGGYGGAALLPPTLNTIGDASAFVPDSSGGAGTGVRIARQGAYTGFVSIYSGAPNTNVSVRIPSQYTAYYEFLWTYVNLGNVTPLVVPFTFFTTATTQAIQVVLTNQTGTSFTASMGLNINRTGDAV